MSKDTRIEVKVSGAITVSSVVIIIAGMKLAANIITPFLLAVFLAIICAQPVYWLKHRKVPGTLATVLVLIGVIGLFVVFGSILGTSVTGFSQQLPFYEDELNTSTRGIITYLNELGLFSHDISISQFFEPGKVMNFTANALNAMAGLMSNAFIISLVMLFFLLEMDSFGLKFRAIFKEKVQASSRNMEEMIHSIRHYLGIKTITSLATGFSIYIWLLIQGVDYPILWGMIAFLMNYIPNIGSLIAAIPAILFAAIQQGGVGAFWAMIAYLVVNMVIGNIIEPKMMGKGMGLSTLIVFLSLIFWGWVLGTVGMFLSVPLTMAAKIAFETNPNTRWIAVLLGTEEDALEELRRESEEEQRESA